MVLWALRCVPCRAKQRLESTLSCIVSIKKMNKTLNKFLLVLSTLAGLCLFAPFAHAQFRVEVSGVGLTQVPIAIVPFKGEEGSPQKIAAIVQADLERSGQFRGVEAGNPGLDEVVRPDFANFRQKNADALVAGSITKLADGRYDVRVRLWDVVRGQDQGGQSHAVVAGDLR